MMILFDQRGHVVDRFDDMICAAPIVAELLLCWCQSPTALWLHPVLYFDEPVNPVIADHQIGKALAELVSMRDAGTVAPEGLDDLRLIAVYPTSHFWHFV